MKNKLNTEDKALLEEYESQEWISVLDEQQKLKYQSIAKETFKKDKRVNIRIASKDLELIRERALVEGIPYQTLMSSVLHKFVYGNLVDRSSN